jgi:hypothetical protein
LYSGCVKWKAVLLSVVAGFGHLYLGRYVYGAVLFSLFLASLNGLFLASVWQGEEIAQRLSRVSAVAGAIVWFAAMAHIVALTYLRDRARTRLRREQLLQEALRAYLRDGPFEAKSPLEAVLKLDLERADPDALFLLGAMSRRCGEVRRARKLLRRCRARDRDNKWTLEVRTELEEIARGLDPERVAQPSVPVRKRGRPPAASEQLADAKPGRLARPVDEPG